jgi:hypothetical protein
VKERHQQGNREADACEQRDAEHVWPEDVVVDLGPGQMGQQPGSAEDAHGFADHQARDHPEHDGVTDQLPTTFDHDTGRQQREEGDGDR